MAGDVNNERRDRDRDRETLDENAEANEDDAHPGEHQKELLCPDCGFALGEKIQVGTGRDKTDDKQYHTDREDLSQAI
ncbi:MAG: hypothetical protein K8T89_04695 [Planctomycetes bacterium]|nr:hypothetical protein [Planctomycetota bacterium]